jgi:hypothetical protein
MFTITNLRTILLVLAAVLVVWFYKDYKYQVSENNRLTENFSQLRRSDSLNYAQQILSSSEIKEYLEYQNKDLQTKLANSGIKVNRIESIISNSFKYRDTTRKETDLSAIVDNIRNNIPTSQEVTDTTLCMTTKGIITYSDNKLKWTVIDRQFQNKSDGVAYWQRRQWKFLGVTTRFLGKKEFTAKVFDQCGESSILRIEKRK